MLKFLSLITGYSIPYGNALTLYREKSCSACDEIDSSLRLKELNFNIVDCDNEKNCPKAPTIIYTKNRVPFSQKNDLSILEDIVQDIDITQLEGPWLILFYKDKEADIERFLQKAALDFPELNVGRIKKEKVPARYVISSYPSIIAFSSGLKKVYEYNLNNISLANFIKTLLGTFKEINLADFIRMKTHIFFVVFYQNENIANFHFREIAHNYKFTARFYKSSDPELIKLAGIDFMQLRSPQKKTSDVLVLSVYKKMKFHKLIIPKFNQKIINEWIFHSHYSNLTRVSNDNLHSIFHAFKPVVLLLTRNEHLCEELEIASEELHEMKPFISYLFAVLDLDQMPGFIEALLPGLKTPKILIYDPSQLNYYVHDDEIKNVKQYVSMLIEKYEKNELQTWPRIKVAGRRVKIYLFLFLFLIMLGFILKRAIKPKTKMH